MTSSTSFDASKPLPAKGHDSADRTPEDISGELWLWRLANLAMLTALATLLWGAPALIMAALAATGLISAFLVSLML